MFFLCLTNSKKVMDSDVVGAVNFENNILEMGNHTRKN